METGQKQQTSNQEEDKNQEPNLHFLQQALNDFSDDDEDSVLGKRTFGAGDHDKKGNSRSQQLIIRKRDLKGGNKGNINLEKIIMEHEKKKISIAELNKKRQDIMDELNDLRNTIGKKLQSGDADMKNKCHWDVLIKEMLWMSEDFDREHKKKSVDQKKLIRACKKWKDEKHAQKEKNIKDMRLEVRKKANNMSKMVQFYWKSVEKVVKHNYNVLYEKKKQQVREKKLESFVSKHLKLSVKVAEQLNTKSFHDKSMYQNKEDEELQAMEPARKRQNVSVVVKAVYEDTNKFYEIDQEYMTSMGQENTSNSQLQLSQGNPMNDNTLADKRKLIAEQTVEMAMSFQPKGITLETAQVMTKVPFILKGELREYQIIGLDWMVTLHNRKLNGILADEMGLGKTIQTISMLASLACDKGIWGPHLIVVPTTIIINWEMEFKKWCPAFKILTYFGSQKERKMKRTGWSKENSFHVCITSYKLVIQDHFAFRRKKWYYMVLDEAQNIKNFRSQRWQTLLRFNTKRRLLLTGTPLQNDVMELWSLMHFLMPTIFSSQQDFKEWFSNPFSQSINQNQTLNISVVQKLQSILRPFLLRRMKRDVEKQLPEKIEHIVQSQLSRRQRLLYDEYINSDKTVKTLTDSDFFSIMNILMQLRKVCNHPDLFEARSIESPFIMQEVLRLHVSSLLIKQFQHDPLKHINYSNLNLVFHEFENMSQLEYAQIQEIYPARPLVEVLAEHSYLDLASLSKDMLCGRPQVDGYALSRSTTGSASILSLNNTSHLASTLPSVLPYETNLYHGVPNYLNSANLPFISSFFALDTANDLLQSSRKSKFIEAKHYSSALNNEERTQDMVEYAGKLGMWRELDQVNRRNIKYRKPIYGEDCRKAVKVDLVFSDVFHLKKHKYIERFSKDEKQIQELYTIPSTVLNPCFQKQVGKCFGYVKVENWETETEESLIAKNDKFSFQLVMEIPRSQMRKRKKKVIPLPVSPQIQVPQYVYEERIVKETTKSVSIVIQKSALNQKSVQRKLSNTSNDQQPADNKNVELLLEDQIIERKVIQKVMVPPSLSLLQTKNGSLGGGNEQDKLEESPYSKNYSNTSKRFKNLDDDTKFKLESVVAGNSAAEIPMEIDNATAGQEENKISEENKDKQDGVDQLQVTDVQETQEQNPNRMNTIEQASMQRNQSMIDMDSSSDDDSLQANNDEQANQQAADSSDTQFSITYRNCDILRDLIVTPLQRIINLEEIVKHFKFIIPKSVAQTPQLVPSIVNTQLQKEKAFERFTFQKLMAHRNVNQSLKYSNILFFPHKNLVQYDCGKLQKLAQLLKHLYKNKSKVLIFTQMTRMLDILETFLNLHGYTYVRLDGSVKVEMRQKLVDRFNLNPKIFCFITSTRCGGIGINLTGADCVVFYDTDWNPAMDKQAQDRCHRIGQTKTVHIYRLISVNTIEENIFKKSLQKRELGGLIIEGNFDMEFFKKVSVKDILEDENLFKPRKKDIMKEENIVFGDLDYEEKEGTEIDYERQQALESYRNKFQEALLRIEDKEDIVAFQNAKREIADEFEEVNQQLQSAEQSTTQGADQTGETTKQQQQQQLEGGGADGQVADSKTQNLYKDLKKNELVNWRTHPKLNEVTKLCIEHFETNYSFDDFMKEKSEKDTKFVNPLKEEDDAKMEEEKKTDAEGGDGGSEFSISDADDDAEQQDDQEMQWDRNMADELFSKARVVVDEIRKKKEAQYYIE